MKFLPNENDTHEVKYFLSIGTSGLVHRAYYLVLSKNVDDKNASIVLFRNGRVLKFSSVDIDDTVE